MKGRYSACSIGPMEMLILSVVVSMGAVVEGSTTILVSARGPDRIKTMGSGREAVATLLACLTDAARTLRTPSPGQAMVSGAATVEAVVRLGVAPEWKRQPIVLAPVRPYLTSLPPPVLGL